MNLRSFAEAFFVAVIGEHIFGEHGGKGEDLRVAGHYGGHDACAEQAGEPDGRVFIEQQEDDVVGGSFAAQVFALGGGELSALRGQRAAGIELGLDGRDIARGLIGNHAKKNAGQPNGHDAQRVEDDGFAELRHLARGETEDGDVREDNGGKRNEGVAQEERGRKAFAGEQRGEGGRFLHGANGGGKSAHAAADDDEGDHAEGEEQDGLETIDPCGAAHASEENVAHHHQRDERATHPEGHDAAADDLERGAAADDSDDDVRHEQRGLHGKDERADVAAFPAVAIHLHRGDEAMLLAERPHARADEEQGEGNDERGGRGHQAEGDDAVVEGVTGSAEDGKGGHVGAEEREKENKRAQLAAGEEEIFRVFAVRLAEGEDADVEDDAEIDEDEDRWDHFVSL